MGFFDSFEKLVHTSGDEPADQEAIQDAAAEKARVEGLEALADELPEEKEEPIPPTFH